MIGIENPEFVYFESNVVAVSFTWDERPVDKLSQIQSLKNINHQTKIIQPRFHWHDQELSGSQTLFFFLDLGNWAIVSPYLSLQLFCVSQVIFRY